MSDLHALVAGFAEVADAYERGRPEYVPAVVAAITEELGVPPGARVLDLAAGTGKLSRPLLEAGFDVVAVEPLPGMLRALRRAIGRERAVEGRAEAIPLDDGSVDAAVCGDAFHWFDADRAAAELRRVVRPGGAVVASWLNARRDERDPVADEVNAVLAPLWRAASHPRLHEDRGADALERHGFGPLRRRMVPFEYATDRDGLLAYFASVSYVGALSPERRADVLARLAGILDAHGVRDVRRPFCADLVSTR